MHKGAAAPAAGWIDQIEVRDDGIWGHVQWTARAKEMLAAKEYSFISPTSIFDPTTREVQIILRAALVNDPAVELAAVAANSSTRMVARSGGTARELGTCTRNL